MKTEIREFTADDAEKIVDYFIEADINFLKDMGVEKNKLPEKSKWIQSLLLELNKPYAEKSYYYLIWLLNDLPVGHSNINYIQFGKSAKMHLHLWKNNIRKSGLGLKFLSLTIPVYFEKFELEKLICEPFSENIAPNKTLLKYGFSSIKTYETIPGPINFKQIVNRYELPKGKVQLKRD